MHQLVAASSTVRMGVLWVGLALYSFYDQCSLARIGEKDTNEERGTYASLIMLISEVGYHTLDWQYFC